jgi:hypothetical protein
LPQVHRWHGHPCRQRPRHLFSPVGPHRRLGRRLSGRQQGRQRRLDLGLAFLGRQVQQPHILLVGPPRLPVPQRVIGPTVGQRRVQVLAVHVAGEGPRLTHQPAADVAIVDAVLLLAAQPLHRLHQRPRVPDLDLLCPDAYLHRLADQTRRHRIGVVLDPDRAAPAHSYPLALHRFQPARRQRPQLLQFHSQLFPPAAVAAALHVAQELPIGLPAGEVAMAPQQQRLFDRLLEAAVPLLAVPVLVTARRVGRLGFEPVMGQQRPVLRRVLLSAALVMDGQRHAVGAVPLRHSAQFPQGVLQPLAQAGEALGDAHADVFPVGVGQHEVIDQVGKRLPLNGHSQAIHVREVGGPQPARLMRLGKEYFLGRAVLRLPLADAPLQRPPAPFPALLRQLPLQPLQERLGLQPRLPLQQFFEARPHPGQWVGPRPPSTRLAYFAGQPAQLPVLPGGLAIHACSHRRLRQRCPPQ